MKKNNKQKEHEMTIKTREEKELKAKNEELRHRGSGFLSCFKCKRVSGMIYTNAKTGEMRIISLKKSDGGYICTECVTECAI